jgi:hypothetical protein
MTPFQPIYHSIRGKLCLRSLFSMAFRGPKYPTDVVPPLMALTALFALVQGIGPPAARPQPSMHCLVNNLR